jgi:adaptin ear-binding coat-associated protein 1/2
VLHRAEDWNLASPIKTCSLLVERRGDTLVLEFGSEGKVFAQSVIDCAPNTNAGGGGPPKRVQHWLEQVVDSSRYFTLKIAGQGGREATIGFGFRDRDVATDLRESIQHYEASIRREVEATETFLANAPKYSIPKLAEGEKIHVNTGRDGGSGSHRIKKEGGISSPSSSNKGIPLLLKKPPPSGPTDRPSSMNNTNNDPVEALAIDIGNIDIQADGGAPNSDDSSGAAVYEGDDDDWDTEFKSATPS